jgi:predicted PurR-regulated permease PerM
MLGLERRAARYVWTAAVVLLLLWLVYVVRTTLFVFVVALLFAYLLSPLVELLDRALPGTRMRPLALGLAYLIFLGIVVLLGSQIGSRVVDEANNLGKKLPDMKWQQPSESPGPVTSLKEQVIARARSEIAQRSSDLLSLVPKAGLKLLTVAGNLIYVVIIPILAFFFLKDAPAIRRHILEMVDEGPQRALVDDLLADVHLLLVHYMRALVLLALATFTVYSIAFAIMGVPYAVLLAALAASLEFIPMIGPLTAGIIILIVAAASGAPVVALLVFLLAYRMFQDYVLSPHLMGQGVQLHPLLVLFGVFAGAEIAGIAGTFLSVPILALLRILYLRIRKARLAEKLSPSIAARL